MKGRRSREERLGDLLERYLSRCDLGESPDPESFCSGEMDLRLEFLELVEHARELDFLADDLRCAPSELQTDPLLGEVIAGRFRIERLIGRGGMGAVYAARNEPLQRPVAIKLLAELRVDRPEARQRFERECLALGKLRQRDIVTAIDHGEHRGRPWFAMERIAGLDLQEWLEFAARCAERGRFFPRAAILRELVRRAAGEEGDSGSSAPLELFWRRPYHELIAVITARVARALAAAHGAGIIHRDVKPSNILLSAEGEVFLTDFGLALLEGEQGLTRALEPLGTPSYMAPEQASRGSAGLDERADVYGLGATLYHLITLRLPFAGTTAEILTNLRHALPPAPRKVRPQVPRDLEAICLRAMEKSPRDRYGNAAELAADLEAFVERRAVRARRPGPLGWLTRWMRRRPLRAALMVLCLALVATGATALYFERQSAAHERAGELVRLRAGLPALLTLEAYPGRSFLRTSREPEFVGQQLDRILALDPGDVIARFYRAMFRSQHGDSAGARSDFDALVAGGLSSPTLVRLRAIATAAEETRRWALPAAGDLPPAQSKFDHFLHGYVALRWQNFESARAELDAALAGPGLAGARELRAIAALGQHDGATALEDAYAVEGRIGAATARTRHVIGAALYLSGEDREAEKNLRAAIALRPEGHAPWHNLGLVLAREGRLSEARAAFEKALSLRPEVWNTRMHLCLLLRDAREYERAQAVLEPALEERAPGVRAQVQLTRATLALEWWRDLRSSGVGGDGAEKRDRARALLEELISASQTPPLVRLKARVNLILLLGESGELEDAKALDLLLGNLNTLLDLLARKPRSQRPFLEDPVLRANIAHFYARLGRLAEAETFLRLALQVETCPNRVRFDLIDVLLSRHQREQALRTILRNADRLRGAPRLDAQIRRILGELPHARRASIADKLRSLKLLAADEGR